MKCCIILASPRPKGNTAALLAPFKDELTKLGHEYVEFSIYNKEIHSCIACRTCQDIYDGFGCVFKDDLLEIFDAVLASDCMILASPIYSWYCTPPMKALLDRFVYIMNKYYGEKRAGSLWKGKHSAIFTTCGYEIDKAADLFEEGMKRYSKHSRLLYAGMFAARDMGYKSDFVTESKLEGAREFARALHSRLSGPVDAQTPPIAVHIHG